MSSLASTSRNTSKRSLTFNKSFVISVTIHILIIFGVSITTYYKIPLFKEAPIINVKLANSNQDLMTNFIDGNPQNSKNNLATFSKGSIEASNNVSTGFKVKRLQANSYVNSEEAVYLNLWQREIETSGDKIISNNEKVDKTAPVLEIEDQITVNKRTFSITGKVSDESAVFVEVDGISIPIKKNKFTFKGAISIGIKKYKVISNTKKIKKKLAIYSSVSKKYNPI